MSERSNVSGMSEEQMNDLGAEMMTVSEKEASRIRESVLNSFGVPQMEIVNAMRKFSMYPAEANIDGKFYDGDGYRGDVAGHVIDVSSYDIDSGENGFEKKYVLLYDGADTGDSQRAKKVYRMVSALRDVEIKDQELRREIVQEREEYRRVKLEKDLEKQRASIEVIDDEDELLTRMSGQGSK